MERSKTELKFHIEPEDSRATAETNKPSLPNHFEIDKIVCQARSRCHSLRLIFAAHQESISICGIVSTIDPARETALSASFIGSPNTSSTETASIAVRPGPPPQTKSTQLPDP